MSSDAVLVVVSGKQIFISITIRDEAFVDRLCILKDLCFYVCTHTVKHQYFRFYCGDIICIRSYAIVFSSFPKHKTEGNTKRIRRLVVTTKTTGISKHSLASVRRLCGPLCLSHLTLSLTYFAY